MVSGQSINARDLLEAQLQAPYFPIKGENSTAPSGQAQGSLSCGNINDDDDDGRGPPRGPQLLPPQDRGEGFIQPSILEPAKLACINIDDQLQETRTLSEAKTTARRAEYTVTVANAPFASIAHEAQKEYVDALEAGDVKNAQCLLKEVSNNLAWRNKGHDQRPPALPQH